MLYPEAGEPTSLTQGPVPKPLGSGTGRHRRPQVP